MMFIYMWYWHQRKKYRQRFFEGWVSLCRPGSRPTRPREHCCTWSLWLRPSWWCVVFGITNNEWQGMVDFVKRTRHKVSRIENDVHRLGSCCWPRLEIVSEKLFLDSLTQSFRVNIITSYVRSWITGSYGMFETPAWVGGQRSNPSCF